MADNVQASTLNQEQRKKLSKVFLTFAWIIEIAAAGVGLSIAINRLTTDTGSMAILASLPFFAVAVMELTKIPLATVIFHTIARKWRNAFAVALVMTMVITFETFVMGFDMYQAEVTKQIKPTVDIVKNLKIKIAATENNINASKKVAGNTNNIDTQYKNQIISINKKYDDIAKAYENERISILKKYDGTLASVNQSIENLKNQLKDRNKQISEERKNLKSDLDQLSKQSNIIGKRLRDNAAVEIGRLQKEKEQLRNASLEDKRQIRVNGKSDYDACMKADAASFFGKDCDDLKTKELQELKSVDERTNDSLDAVDQQIKEARQKLSTSSFEGSNNKDATIRSRYQSTIKKLEREKTNINKKIAKRISERARITGNIEASDKAQIKELDRKIGFSNTQRGKELSEAKDIADQRRKQADSAKTDVASITKQANSLRGLLAPKCAELNNVVYNNQVYRLATQFFGIDDACDLTQEQLTITQWIWFGSLAFILSALGTTLAFAGLVIKYPPNNSGSGLKLGLLGIIRRTGKELLGITRRINYALALAHRRLRSPKIKKVEVTVEKEVIKEVTKEVPVDKVVFKEIPKEIVKKEIVHVPLFTQDIKAVVRDE